MNILLIGTGCPKCNILKKKLEQKNIKFEEIEGQQAIDSILEIGFNSAPVLMIDRQAMSYEEAVVWVNSYAEEGDKN